MDSYMALQVDETGTAMRQLDVQPLAEQEVRIEVHFSSLNYKDALAVTGKGRIMRRLPLVAGIDAAGIVVESRSTAFKSGDEVLVTGYELSQSHDGGYAQYLQVPAEWVVALPFGISLQNAMSMGTAGFTAGLAVQRLLENRQSADWGPVVVTGASGGVGSIAVCLLAQLGFEVTAISGKPAESAAYLKHLGARTVLDRHELTLGERPLESAQWAGAVDTVGGALLSWLTRCIQTHGNIAVCGLAGGIELQTTVMPFIIRGVSLLGVDSATCPMPIRQEVWQWLTTEVRVPYAAFVTATIALSDVMDVAQRMLNAETKGRYVVAIK